MASLVGRVPLRNIGPRSAGAQHPQNAVQHSATIFPRSPSSISATYWFRDKVVQRFPLHVREVSGICERHDIPFETVRSESILVLRRDSLLLRRCRFPAGVFSSAITSLASQAPSICRCHLRFIAVLLSHLPQFAPAAGLNGFGRSRV